MDLQDLDVGRVCVWVRMRVCVSMSGLGACGYACGQVSAREESRKFKTSTLTILLDLEHKWGLHVSHRKLNVTNVATFAGWSYQTDELETCAVAVLWDQCLYSLEVLLPHGRHGALPSCPLNPREVVVVRLRVELGPQTRVFALPFHPLHQRTRTHLVRGV